MTTYYVSNNGSDTAAGTSTSSAFASLARATQAMAANSSADTAYGMDGTYEVNSPIALTEKNSGDTIAAYQDAAPVISGATSITGWMAGADGAREGPTLCPTVSRTSHGPAWGHHLDVELHDFYVV